MPKISKWGKFSIALAIVALCCFIFAGVAMAAPVDSAGIVALDPYGNPQIPQTHVVKGSHTYNYGIFSGLFGSIDVGVFVDQPIVVEFPTVADPTATQFDLTPAVGKTVPIRVFLVGGDPNGVILQTIPTIDNVAHTATFIIQKQNLPQVGYVYDFQIEGLQVKNTCLPGSYCVKLRHPCFTGGISACLALRVMPTVESITLDVPATPYVKGSTIQVSGKVWGNCSKPWPFDTWPVVIDIVNRKGMTPVDPYDLTPQPTWPIEDGETVMINCSATHDPCISERYICPTIAHTVQMGSETIFKGPLKLPACEEYGLDYTIRARTLEAQDCYTDPIIEYVSPFTVDCQLVPAEGLEDFAGATGPGGTHIIRSPFESILCGFMTQPHSWLEANPMTITLVPGIPAFISSCIDGDCVDLSEETIPFDKPYNFCVTVHDKFRNVTTVRDAGGLKVDLVAYQISYDGWKEVAGIFKDAAGNEITHIWIPQGQSGICVTFYPKKLGPITIDGRSIINMNRSIARCLVVANEPTQAKLDITAKVVKDIIYGTDIDGDPIITHDVPVAGWPLSAAIWLKDDAGNDIHATQDFDVYISLRSANDGNDENWAEDSVDEFCAASCATWDTALDVTFNKAGLYDGRGDIFTPDHTTLLCKVCHPWDKYTHPYCTVKSHFYVYPSVSCVCQPIFIQAKLVGKTTGRVILTNTVQVGPFADPVDLKRVLNAETWQVLSTPQELVGSGGMDSLMPTSSFTDVLTYKDYQWYSLGPSDKLDPLFGYYVKTKQRAVETDPNCYVAKYIFNRVTDPGMDIPPTRTVVQGWNLIGTALPDKISLPPAETISLSGDFWNEVPCDSGNCEGYPTAKLIQPEFLGNMLGTTCEACKQVYNIGGPGLGITIDVNTQTLNTDIILNGDPNSKANLAGFTAASISNGNINQFALNPLYLVFNGDAYWLYMTKTQELAAEVGQSLVDDVLLEDMGGQQPPYPEP